MTKLEFETILSQKNNLQNLPNTVLESYLSRISEDFESTKQNLMKMTYHLDNLEDLYNTILKVYQTRVNE